jgi:hypothetical protein
MLTQRICLNDDTPSRYVEWTNHFFLVVVIIGTPNVDCITADARLGSLTYRSVTKLVYESLSFIIDLLKLTKPQTHVILAQILFYAIDTLDGCSQQIISGW